MATDVCKIMAATIVHISVTIYVGDPIDYPRYRHTSLYLEFANQEPSALVHVVGPIGEFEFTVQDGYDPSQDSSLARKVDLGRLSVEDSRPNVIRFLRAVPIHNWGREFNCQSWVELALKRLTMSGMLSSEWYERGVDEMVDAISEARDEEI